MAVVALSDTGAAKVAAARAKKPKEVTFRDNIANLFFQGFARFRQKKGRLCRYVGCLYTFYHQFGIDLEINYLSPNRAMIPIEVTGGDHPGDIGNRQCGALYRPVARLSSDSGSSEASSMGRRGNAESYRGSLVYTPVSEKASDKFNHVISEIYITGPTSIGLPVCQETTEKINPSGENYAMSGQF